MRFSESIGPQKQLHNLETGTVTIGEWTGIYYRKGIDGRTH